MSKTGHGWQLCSLIRRASEHRPAGHATALIALVDVEPQEHAAEARATRDLLRVLGHEVRNAMAPITSLAEGALAGMVVPDRRDRSLPKILDTLARRADGLRRFTEAYLQVARPPEPALGAVVRATRSRSFCGACRHPECAGGDYRPLGFASFDRYVRPMPHRLAAVA